MTPLERRYRRLLRLLPEAHRAARGEELLGLLLDLDEGRTRPSIRQALGLAGLAARLRLGGAAPTATVLFSAFLVAFSTAQLGMLVDGYTGGLAAVEVTRMPYLASLLLTPALLQAAVPVAWALGACRSALVLQVAATASVLAVELLSRRHDPLTAMLGDVSLGFFRAVAVALLLSVAVRRRWATPRPRGLWVAAVPLAVLAEKGTYLWGRHGMYYPTVPPYVGWVAAAVVAVAALILLRQYRWPVLAVGVLAATVVGRYLPSILVHLVYGEYGWLISITVGTAVVVGGAALLGRQLRAARPE